MKVIVGYCMTCHKIRLPDGTWGVPEQSLDNYTLSHGYCEPCGDRAMANAEAYIARMEMKKIEWIIPAVLGPFRAGELLLCDKREFGIGGGR